MGRRDNRNKNTGRVRSRIARKKFRRTMCSKCRLCHASTQMRVCYNKLYLKDPEKFVNVVLPRLIERHAEIEALKAVKFKTPILDELQVFKEIVCDADICPHCNGTTRKSLEVCYTSFIAQTRETQPAKQIHKLRKKPPDEPAVMMAYISNNNDFEQEVLRILDDYNNNKKSAEGPLFEDHDKQHDQDSTAGHYIEGYID